MKVILSTTRHQQSEMIPDHSRTVGIYGLSMTDTFCSICVSSFKTGIHALKLLTDHKGTIMLERNAQF